MSASRASKIITVGVLIAVLAVLLPFGVACTKAPRPAADFTASYVSGMRLLEDPIAGTAPLTVKFTDQSAGEITSWRWNFGDGTVIGPGTGAEYQNPEHTYTTTNSGFIVVLTVRGPGGRASEEKTGIVTVFSCSEAANAELNQARQAIRDCLEAAGSSTLDAEEPAWDGSWGKVVVGGHDAASYLGIWSEFKATYYVALNGTITTGTDVSWGCIYWNPYALGMPRWTGTA